jgi:hypothetical protein
MAVINSLILCGIEGYAFAVNPICSTVKSVKWQNRDKFSKNTYVGKPLSDPSDEVRFIVSTSSRNVATVAVRNRDHFEFRIRSPRIADNMRDRCWDWGARSTVFGIFVRYILSIAV